MPNKKTASAKKPAQSLRAGSSAKVQAKLPKSTALKSTRVAQTAKATTSKSRPVQPKSPVRGSLTVAADKTTSRKARATTTAAVAHAPKPAAAWPQAMSAGGSVTAHAQDVTPKVRRAPSAKNVDTSSAPALASDQPCTLRPMVATAPAAALEGQARLLSAMVRMTPLHLALQSQSILLSMMMKRLLPDKANPARPTLPISR